MNANTFEHDGKKFCTWCGRQIAPGACSSVLPTPQAVAVTRDVRRRAIEASTAVRQYINRHEPGLDLLVVLDSAADALDSLVSAINRVAVPCTDERKQS